MQISKMQLLELITHLHTSFNVFCVEGESTNGLKIDIWNSTIEGILNSIPADVGIVAMNLLSATSYLFLANYEQETRDKFFNEVIDESTFAELKNFLQRKNIQQSYINGQTVGRIFEELVDEYVIQTSVAAPSSF